MKDIFSLKRFGKFLAYDLNQTRLQYGLSLLVLGFLPCMYVAFRFLCNIFSEFGHYSAPGFGAFMSMFFLAVIVAVISGPARIYGSLTDKKAGADYILLPASTLEKFLSMITVTCVVIPLALSFLFFVQYLVFRIFLPEYAVAMSGIRDVIDTVSTNEEVRMSVLSMVMGSWAVWCLSILPFVLGAVFFKKAKAAKTILVLIGISFVMSMLATAVVKNVEFGFLEEWVEDMIMNPKSMQHLVNWGINVVLVVPNLILMGLLYLRLKTIKH